MWSAGWVACVVLLLLVLLVLVGVAVVGVRLLMSLARASARRWSCLPSPSGQLSGVASWNMVLVSASIRDRIVSPVSGSYSQWMITIPVSGSVHDRKRVARCCRASRSSPDPASSRNTSIFNFRSNCSGVERAAISVRR